jgi:phage shock protein PspC (stress-responsive transcriptional regulator)
VSLADELERLADLHTRGILTDDEFGRAKQLLLSGDVRRESAVFERSLQRLKRSTRDQYLGGVCAGLAEATGLPVWLWRAGFIVLGVSFGVGIVLYLALWILVPSDQTGPAAPS